MILSSAITLLTFGFLLGLQHAFDADHIAAISTMVAKHLSIKKSSLIALFWGMGHTTALLLAGIIILALKWTIPQKISLSLEFIVGLMLIFLGIRLLLQIRKEKIHLHQHEHDGTSHIHLHSHAEAESHQHAHRSMTQSLLIGLVHGLASSGALALLVLTNISSVTVGIGYILIFGIGSVAGMMLISTIISVPFAFASEYLKKAQKGLKIAAGIMSITIGLSIVYQIRFIQHLF